MTLFWVKITDTITIGNIGTVVSIVLFLIYSYYRIRRYLVEQHIEFIKYLGELQANQTSKLENTIKETALNDKPTDTP